MHTTQWLPEVSSASEFTESVKCKTGPGLLATVDEAME